MSEVEPLRTTLDPRWLQSEYEWSTGYVGRWDFYRHTVDGINFHKKALSMLGQVGCESVLDIGCGQGECLRQVQENTHSDEPSGLLVGMDISHLSGNEANLVFIRGNASVDSDPESPHPNILPFTDNNFDVVMSFFMLYHAIKPEATLREFIRVAKPGARFAIATSGPGNKHNHRRYERMVARTLGVEPPPVYSSYFNSAIADKVLRSFFKKVKTWKQSTRVEFKEEDFVIVNGELVPSASGKVGDLKWSMQTMDRHYKPPVKPTDIGEVVVQKVYPDILRRIRQNGVLIEPIHRKLYICSDPKTD